MWCPMAMFVMRVHLNSFRHEDSNWHKLANVRMTPPVGSRASGVSLSPYCEEGVVIALAMKQSGY